MLEVPRRRKLGLRS